MPGGHLLAEQTRQLTPNDLDGQDVIVYSPVQARYFNELLISTFTIAGAAPRYVQFVTQVRERPVGLDAARRSGSTNPALLRLLRDVLPQREWTTDDLVDEFVP